MKFGVGPGACPGQTIQEQMAAASRAGFLGFEPILAEEGPFSLETTKEQALALKADANALGIQIHSILSGLAWAYPLTSSDATIRQKAADTIKKQLELASYLGCESILVVPGAVTADISYDRAYENAMTELSKLANLAQSCQVQLAVENVWNKFLLSPLEMRSFLDDINSPWVKAYFDVGNVVEFGFPEQWIRILDKRIAMVHVKDYLIPAGRRGGWVDILSGDVPYDRVFQAFADIGYSGWVTAEVGPVNQAYPEELLLRTRHALKTIFES